MRCFYVKKHPGDEPGPVRPPGRPHPPLHRHGRSLAALASPLPVSPRLQVGVRGKLDVKEIWL